MKTKRQDKILEIIENYDIETQDELIKKLGECGFSATQATISRDIKELGLVKGAGGVGYRYDTSQNQTDATPISDKFIGILRDTVISVDYANNLVVIKTYAGMAQGAAAALDSLSLTEIVGSIAGDDTIMIVLRTNAAASDFTLKFREIIKKKNA